VTCATRVKFSKPAAANRSLRLRKAHATDGDVALAA
jgi:hypothetical protein